MVNNKDTAKAVEEIRLQVRELCKACYERLSIMPNSPQVDQDTFAKVRDTLVREFFNGAANVAFITKQGSLAVGLTIFLLTSLQTDAWGAIKREVGVS